MTAPGKKSLWILLACAGLTVTLPAAADRGWGFGMGLMSGTLIGASLARPYYYWPPYYAAYPAPTTVVVQTAAPPAPYYAAAAPMPQASMPAWYYCDAAQGYYPYVPQCPQPWRMVPAR